MGTAYSVVNGSNGPYLAIVNYWCPVKISQLASSVGMTDSVGVSPLRFDGITNNAAPVRLAARASDKVERNPLCLNPKLEVSYHF